MKALWLIAFLLLLSPAYALTASPAKQTIATPDGELAYSLTLRNDETYTMEVSFSPDGPFAGSIEVPNTITLATGEQQVVPVRVRIPPTVQPGTLHGGILIESRGAAGGTVAASSAVFHVIELVTPQEGAYVEGELLTSSSSEDKPTAITLVLRNTGTEEVAATVDMAVDAEELLTEDLVLPVGSTQNVVVYWTPPDTDTYVVRARTQYAGKQFSLSKEITAGNLSAVIQDVTFSDFTLGAPFRVSVIVESAWGQPLPVVASAVLIQGGVVGAAESTPVTIRAGEPTAIPIFLESNGLRRGDAQLQVQIGYAGKQDSLIVPLTVREDSIGKKDGAAAAEGSDIPWLYVIGLGILAISIIFIKRRRSSSDKGA